MKYNLNRVFQREPFVFVSLGMILGILLSTQFVLAISQLLIPILLIALLLIYKKWNYSYLIVMGLSLSIGVIQYQNYNSQFNRNLQNLSNTNNVKIEFKGIIHSIEEFSSGNRITLNNVYLRNEKILHTDSFKYHVFPKEKRLEDISFGDTLSGSGKFQLFREVRNPGQFDSKKFYNNKHILGRIYSNHEIESSRNIGFIFRKSIDQFRSGLKDKLTHYSDSETSALLSALILGYRNEIDQELRESFVNVGVVHVFAVSGLHVGYVLLILMILVKLIRMPWGWNKVLIILGLIIFSMISGGRPSVIRASLMAGLYVLSPLFNRKPNSWNLIAVAAFIILLLNPNALFDLGFQLSFTAVISIVFFYSFIIKYLPEKMKPKNIQNTFLRFLWSLFLVSLSAQLGTIPGVAIYFGRIPIIAIIANIFVIPIIGLFVALGFVKLIFFWIPPISYLTEQVVWLTKEIVNGIIYIFNQVPFASIQTPQFSISDLLIYLSILLVGVSLLQKRYPSAIIFTLLFINLAIWPRIFENDKLDIVFFDLRSNEATIIKNGESNILINNGVSSMFTNDIDQRIIPSLKYLKIDEIDLFIKGAGNSNHKIGSVKLLEKIPIKIIWDAGFDSNSSYDSYFQNLSGVKHADYINNNDSSFFSIDRNVHIYSLLPLNNDEDNSNYAMLLINKESKSLLVDQLTPSECNGISELSELSSIDIFKIKYPREVNSELVNLIKHLNPKWTIITGSKTSNKQPTYEEIKKMVPNKLFMTDSIGAFWLTSDGKSIEVKNWK